MEKPGRLYIDRQHPLAYRSALEFVDTVKKIADEAGLGRDLVELINVRCSQINRCPSCLKAHVPQLVRAGIDATKIAVIPAWRDVALFSAEERAVLEMAELATELPQARDADARYDEIASVLTPDQVSAAAWIAVAINAFNRISILSGHPVR
ncbi:MAG: carboxymuconolactone decarboxylase family protein [Flaviflexus sp.]|uniref:Carboxymuconolactone decarboxylase family protein n=1 Tax=Flaviflexus ciconiae TaxID=2496867 RepID=A0A3Q9G375_9ACTO|nr:carboxymuconolactone decarboxylase family protein [Flaviflexus ciconiae]AZQ76659.1 carboxymuconolactone decarboxylase family protein [Flaviflexus ciconiae]